MINPGAENQLDGWTQMGVSLAITDSIGKRNKNYYPRSGSYCFAGGTGSSPSELHQRIDLVGVIQGFTEEQLDSGKLTVFVSFYYQTYDNVISDDDFSKVNVTILSHSLDISGEIQTEKLYCIPNPGWCHYQSVLELFIMLSYFMKGEPSVSLLTFILMIIH